MSDYIAKPLRERIEAYEGQPAESLWHGEGHRWDAIMAMLDRGMTNREIRDAVNVGVPYRDKMSLRDVKVYRAVHDNRLDWSGSDELGTHTRQEWVTLSELIYEKEVT